MSDCWDPDDYYDRIGDDDPICRRCGSDDVIWRTNSEGNWRLYEASQRIHPGNRLMMHSCAKASLDDFDEVIE